MKSQAFFAQIVLSLYFLVTVFVPASRPSVAAQGDAFRAAIDNQRTLRIEGTEAAETIIAEVIGDAASGASDNAATISLAYRRQDGTGTIQNLSFRLEAFDRVVINARGGNDFVNVIDAAEALDRQRKALTLDGGEGDNVVVLTHLPFKPEQAERIKELLDLSRQMEDLANQASTALSQVLVNDAMKLVESVRVDLMSASQALASDAEGQLLAPARALTARNETQFTNLGNALIARSDEIGKQHATMIDELAKKYVPASGNFPPDNDSEDLPRPTPPDANRPDTDPAREREAADLQARAERLAQVGQKLSDDAKAQLEPFARQLENNAASIEQQANEFEARAEQLRVRAEQLAVNSERDMSAAAERVLAVIARLRNMEGNLREAGSYLREEFLFAVSMKPESQANLLKAGASGCGTPINTTHTYNGGGGNDFFFPVSAPWSSWAINGGAGNDILLGGLVADDIHGGAGNDKIFGLGGKDQIHGDDGTDLLVGEFIIDLPFFTGDDCIWGGGGTDFVFGDNIIATSFGTAGGNDSLWGDDDVDLIIGDDGISDIFSQTKPGGNDAIEGNKGMDFLFGCGGNDDIKSNEDMDFVQGNGGDDVINGGDGQNFTFCNTTVQLGNLLLGGDGKDDITGGAGIDVIFGNKNDDKLTGKDQVDLMFGGDNEDEMHGDAGGQICTVNINNVSIPVRLGNLMFGGNDDDKMWAGGDLDLMFGQNDDDRIHGYDGSGQQPFAIDADLLFGGNGNDYLEGDDESIILTNSFDLIFGEGGDDEIHGGSQSDLMFGGTGLDTMHGDSNAIQLISSHDLMFGGDGDDWMDGGNAADLLLGNSGNDTMLGDDETPSLNSSDLMFGGPGNDTMNGGCSSDLMFGGNDDDHMLGDSNYFWEPLSADLMFGQVGSDFMDGGNAMDLMFGGSGCDTMLGDNNTPGRISPDLMFGEAGNDDMNGGNSTDFMSGGDDNDKLVGDANLWWQLLSSDFMSGGSGCDTMFGGRAFDFMLGDPGVDQMDGQAGGDMMFGGANSDVMNGGDFFDFIWGNEGNDLIHGDDWPDFIMGGDGDDCLFGDGGLDFIWGGAGNDCIHGGAFMDLLFGNDGNDLIFGDGGSDMLFGGAGDDKLDGGSGFDTIFGGTGNDTGWRGPGGAVFFSIENKNNGSSGLECECQVEVCTGKICIHKFNDLNGDGIQQNGEPNLPGWVFQVTGNSTCVGATVTTDANGNACGDFYAGTYTITEQPQNGWMATTPTTQTVSVTAGQMTNVFFGNRQVGRGELCVIKFNDLNANGVQDTGEAGLPNWSFTVTGLGGVATTLVTSQGGRVCFSLPAGTYAVTETPQAGWTATTATTQSVTITAGQATIVSFGNREKPSKPCVLDDGLVNVANTFVRRAVLAQTFTPTQTGLLVSVVHGLRKGLNSVNDYSLLVTTTTGGVPAWNGGSFNNPAVLFAAPSLTKFASTGLADGQVAIPLGQQPLLTAGTTYAIVLIPGTPSTGVMQWQGNSSANSYPNGSAYELNGSTWVVPGAGPKDHGFRLIGSCN